jgi:metal-sulfur cluster biosynthetic enzyme
VSDETSRTTELHERVLEALREVIDPELGLNVVELGLVYGVDIDAGRVQARLTMTTPACPLGEQIVRDAQERIAACEGVAEARVDLVWEPPWSPSRMSASAKEALGWST